MKTQRASKAYRAISLTASMVLASLGIVAGCSAAPDAAQEGTEQIASTHQADSSCGALLQPPCATGCNAGLHPDQNWGGMCAMCGSSGQACCDTLNNSPQVPLCYGAGIVCGGNAGMATLSSNQCQAGCGAPTQPGCQIVNDTGTQVTACQPGSTLVSGVCQACGAKDQPVCVSSTACGNGGNCNVGCNAGLLVTGTQCEPPPPCGAQNEACCNNTTCNGGLTCQGNKCEPPPPCGAQNEVCCNGSACNSGLACQSNKCEPPPPPPACGKQGQGCCNGSACISGLTCQANKCEPPPVCRAQDWIVCENCGDESFETLTIYACTSADAVASVARTTSCYVSPGYCPEIHHIGIDPVPTHTPLPQ